MSHDRVFSYPKVQAVEAVIKMASDSLFCYFLPSHLGVVEGCEPAEGQETDFNTSLCILGQSPSLCHPFFMFKMKRAEY